MIHHLSKEEFLDLVYGDKAAFMASIEAGHGYVVKRFHPAGEMAAFREFLVEIAASSEPSWHPCLDGCPDYHRINDEYPKSWVKAKMHSFYFHRWCEHRDIFEGFKEIFELKNFLAGADPDAHYDTLPSSGVISRVVAHQYPRGGGYLQEHVDPTSPFAMIQTILQGSHFGRDFSTGGLYFRETPDGEAHFVDPISEMGDLIVLSPDLNHGVAPIDPESELDWARTDGRWMVLPVIIRSDYEMDPETKPKAVNA